MKSSASEPDPRNWKKMGGEEKRTCLVGVAMCDFNDFNTEKEAVSGN